MELTGVTAAPPEPRENLSAFPGEHIGRAFDVPQQANPLADGLTPILRVEELHQLGFKVIVFGIDLLMHITKTMQLVLLDIRSGRFALQGTGATFKEYVSAVGYEDWANIENRHGTSEAAP